MLILVTHFFVSSDNADESLTMYGQTSPPKKNCAYSRVQNYNWQFNLHITSLLLKVIQKWDWDGIT